MFLSTVSVVVGCSLVILLANITVVLHIPYPLHFLLASNGIV